MATLIIYIVGLVNFTCGMKQNAFEANFFQLLKPRIECDKLQYKCVEMPLYIRLELLSARPCMINDISIKILWSTLKSGGTAAPQPHSPTFSAAYDYKLLYTKIFWCMALLDASNWLTYRLHYTVKRCAMLSKNSLGCKKVAAKQSRINAITEFGW